MAEKRDRDDDDLGAAPLAQAARVDGAAAGYAAPAVTAAVSDGGYGANVGGLTVASALPTAAAPAVSAAAAAAPLAVSTIAATTAAAAPAASSPGAGAGAAPASAAPAATAPAVTAAAAPAATITTTAVAAAPAPAAAPVAAPVAAAPAPVAAAPAPAPAPVVEAAPAAAEAEAEEEEIYCLCRQPWGDRTMTECDQCNEWFHNGCVGLSEVPLSEEAVWRCPNCTGIPVAPTSAAATAQVMGMGHMGGMVQPPPPKCYCGVDAARGTVNEDGPNFGRPFWGCGSWPATNCQYFAWR